MLTASSNANLQGAISARHWAFSHRSHSVQRVRNLSLHAVPQPYLHSNTRCGTQPKRYSKHPNEQHTTPAFSSKGMLALAPCVLGVVWNVGVACTCTPGRDSSAGVQREQPADRSKASNCAGRSPRLRIWSFFFSTQSFPLPPLPSTLRRLLDCCRPYVCMKSQTNSHQNKHRLSTADEWPSPSQLYVFLACLL